MDLRIQGTIGEDDLARVRGVGSYCQMLQEAVIDFGQKYNLHLVKEKADYYLIPGFKPYELIQYENRNQTIIVIHDVIPLKHPEHFPPGLKGSMICFLNRLTIAKTKLIITDSQVVKQEIQQHLGVEAEKIKVVYPATKKLFYSLTNNQPLDYNYPKLPDDFILYIGDITWNKNLFNLGQAMLMTNIPLVLVGKALTNYNNLEHPEKAAFRSFLHLAKHNPQFIFLGYAPDDQLLSLYRRARLVVLPSYDEGFGLPWLEAALQKKPVVLSDLEIFREITNGQAQYFDPQNPEAIAKQIIMSYNHFDQTRIEKQYRLATTYSQENFIKNLAAAINSIS